MSADKYIAAVDFGSNDIKVAVAKLGESGDSNSKTQIISLVKGPSDGVKRGVITNMSAASNALTKVIDDAQNVIGLPIEKAVFGITGSGIAFTNSEGLVINTREGSEISAEDIDRLVEDAINKAYGIRYNELLHVITKSYKVDNQKGIKNPIGMVGNKIESEVLIISSETSFLRNFSKAVDQTGIESLDKIYTPLATSDFLLTDRQKKAGTVMVDLGASATSYVVWEGDEIVHTGSIPIGSINITQDLALGLKTTIEMAEEVKVNHLDLSPEKEGESKTGEIEVHNPDLKKNELLNLSEAELYAQARVEEIFDYLNKDLKEIGKYSRLPGGVVLTGGGANLKGITDIAQDKMRLPVFKFDIKDSGVDFLPDYDGDPIYINCIALASYYLKNSTLKDYSNSPKNAQKKSLKKTLSPGVSDSSRAGNKIVENIRKFFPWT